jgi:DNA-binding transcriptional LysR family regulator
MTSKQIEYFLAVSKYLNFTQAGEVLYTSQPTISRQISLLEEELGFELFVRSNHNIRLTPAGTVMQKTFQEMTEFFEEQKKLAVQASKGIHGSITIGLLKDMNLEKFIMPHLNLFMNKFPNINIYYKCYPTGDFIKAFEKKEIDVAFVHYFNVFQNKNYQAKDIFSTKMQLLYGANHPLAQKSQVSLKDFQNETYYTTKSAYSDNLKATLDKITKHYEIQPFKIETFEYFDTILLYVRMGCGFAFVDPLVFRYLEDDGFKMLELDQEIGDVNFQAIWDNNNINPAIPLLMEYISKNKTEINNSFEYESV